MKKLFALIILLSALVIATAVFADNTANTVFSEAVQTLNLMDDVVITSPGSLKTLRIMEIDTPVKIKGSKNDFVTIKLLSSKKGSASLDLAYEIMGEEIWLAVEKVVRELFEEDVIEENLPIRENDDGVSLEDEDRKNVNLQEDSLQELSLDFWVEISIPTHMNVVLGETVNKGSIIGVAGVDMNAGIGDFVLENITGFVRIRDNAGTLRLKNVTGDVWISDKGGAISVENVTGLVTIDSDVGLALRVQDVTGDVTISSKLGGSAEVANVKGNVSVFSRAPIKTACIGITGNVIVPEN
ncbi:MAG: hypothetical protein PHD88_03660 [Firmicutes bacterium]|nr:hypothetical protein [Bacillota bacterium]MDD4262875.1 hypothetical protein [Bacillota bacterium]MDD4693487.1 hypothetical protein [Bacillota bacterium]